MASKKYEQNKAKFADKLWAAYPSLGANAHEVFAKIVSYDPSADAKSEKHQHLYLEWVCSRVLKEKPREQDLYKIREDLYNYVLLARLDKVRASRPGTIYYAPFVNPEISQYSIASLSSKMLPYETLIKDRKKSAEALENEKANAERDSIVLYNGLEGRIVIPLTMEASQYWGKGTKWCISATKSDNLFETYDQSGTKPILMFLPKGTQEKFATNEHDKDVRDMMDEPLGGRLRKGDSSGKNQSIDILSGFIAKVFSSGQLQTDKILDNDHIVRAFHDMALRAPAIYQAILQKTERQFVPSFFEPTTIIKYSGRYMKPDLFERPNDSEVIGTFYSHREFLIEVMTNPDLEHLKKGATATLNVASIEKTALDIIEDMMRVPEDGLTGTPDEILQQFKAKYMRASQFNEGLEGHGYQFESIIDNLAIDYLKHVPKELWKDTSFAFDALKVIDFLPTMTLNVFPEAYQHPLIWHELMVDDGLNLLARCEDIKAPAFHHIWGAQIDGKPFLESILPVIEYPHHAMDIYQASEDVEGVDYTPLTDIVRAFYPDGLKAEDDVRIVAAMPKCNLTDLTDKYISKHPQYVAISDLSSAIQAYEGLEHIEGLDLSLITRKVEGLYPHGVGNADDILAISEQMPKCDFTKLLEISVAQRPELFADIAPERQTLPMAIAAIQHDPGSLADMAAHLFAGKTRAPELTAAFNKLPPDSMERGAVADYFTVPEVR